MRQRLILAACVALAASLWFLARSPLTAADLASGLTLIHPAIGQTLGAIIVTLLVSLPVMAVCAAACASGHPLSGLFTGSASLIFLSAAGGSMEGWVRGIDAPSAYRTLAVEMIFWQIGAMLVLATGLLFRPWLRNRWRWLSQETHAGPGMSWFKPAPTSLMAGGVTAVVAGMATIILLRSSDTGQIIGGLLVAFTAGGLAGQYAFPQERNPLGMLLAPGVVAIVAYLYVSMHYADVQAIQSAWFAQVAPGAGLKDRLPGVAMALPIHYISAGLTGVVLGITLGQCMQAAQKQAAAAAA